MNRFKYAIAVSVISACTQETLPPPRSTEPPPEPEPVHQQCQPLTIADGATAGLEPTRQEQELWCWATVAQQIAKTYGAELKQCEIVNLFPRTDEPIDCCIPENAIDPKCNHAGSPNLLLRLLNIEHKVTDKPLSKEGLQFVLTSGRPVIAVYEARVKHIITGEPLKLQHVQTINGYAPGGDSFELLNSSPYKWPEYASVWSTYDELLTYNHGTTEWHWTATVFDIGDRDNSAKCE